MDTGMTVAGPIFVVLAIVLILMCMWAFCIAVFGAVLLSPACMLQMFTLGAHRPPHPDPRSLRLRSSCHRNVLYRRALLRAGLLGPMLKPSEGSAWHPGHLGVLQHTLQLHHVRQDASRKHPEVSTQVWQPRAPYCCSAHQELHKASTRCGYKCTHACTTANVCCSVGSALGVSAAREVVPGM